MALTPLVIGLGLPLVMGGAVFAIRRANRFRPKIASVLVKQGNIFEGGADLTVLPCSAKGTVSTSCRGWINLFNLDEPKAPGDTLRLGDITSVREFHAPNKFTKYTVFAASVLNDETTAAAIESIGAELGRLTRENEAVRIIETPLLGTGAGRLGTNEAGDAIAKGFRRTGASDAALHIFVFDTERRDSLHRRLHGSGMSRLWDAVTLQPGFGGISVNLKKIFGGS